MKKKGKQKNSVRKSKKNHSNNELFRGIVLLVFVIIGLTIIGLSVKNEDKQDKKYSNEINLGSLNLFGYPDYKEMNYEVLNVLSYELSEDDKTISFTLSRNSNSGVINKIFVAFNRTNKADCFYNITQGFPVYPNQALYTIAVSSTSCGTNFTGIYNILAVANLTAAGIDLTQTEDIPDFELYQNEYRENAIDLDDYFTNLGSDKYLNYEYYVSESEIKIKNDSEFFSSHLLDLNATDEIGDYSTTITLNYPGISSVTSNTFIVSIIEDNCTDGDGGENYTYQGTAKNFTYNGTDYCYNTTSVREYYCSDETSVNSYIISCGDGYYCEDGACIYNSSQNRSPIFDSENCDITEFTWNNKETLTKDLSDCFSDPDEDYLTYSYSKGYSSHIKITISNSTLTLKPNSTWSGSGYFYIYADDGLHEITATINFQVNSPSESVSVPVNSSSSLKIINPVPESDTINETYGENLTFAIGNDISNLDSIKWYLDNELIKEDSSSILISGLITGSHILEIQIKRGVFIDSKSWKINIYEEKPEQKFVFNSGKIMLYVILIIVALIITLIIWLFIKEKNNKNKNRLDLSGLNKKHDSESTTSGSFNIPR